MVKKSFTDAFPDDDQLIQETLEGKSEAFGLLMRRHQSPLMDLALRMLRNPEEAEDVVQQVFIEAYRHLADFRHGSRLSTWLYSITLNRLRNHLRSRKNKQWVPIDMAPSDSGEPRTLQLRDNTPAIDQQMEKKLDLEWIRRQVLHLQPEYQDIFMMHYFQNISLQEVAERVGRPLGTVKVYLHRARKALYQRRQKETAE